MEARERFLAACRRETVDRPPVWMMRQAAVTSEYRKSRVHNDFLSTCHEPSLACEVTLMPLRRFELDAAIIFSDILVVPEAMGCEVSYPPGGRTRPPVKTKDDLDSLRDPDPKESLAFVADALRKVGKAVPDKALLGFAGAPFTIASYMTESPGRERPHGARTMLYKDLGLFTALMEKLTDAIGAFLRLQIEAGADAVQLFDTWAGDLTLRDYERHVLPWHRKIFDAIADLGAPRILYVGSGGNVLELMAQSGADVIGVDWRVDMAEARRRLGPDVALQGNVDPLLLFGPPEKIRAEVRRVHEQMEGRGHIFNLGHGILPGTPVGGAQAFVDAVLELGA